MSLIPFIYSLWKARGLLNILKLKEFPSRVTGLIFRLLSSLRVFLLS